MLLKVNDLAVLTNNISPVYILKDISFTVTSNSVFTITGKNGSGKSTLIKSLTRLLDRNSYSVSGSVYLDGKSLLQMSEDEILEIRRHKIKYVFQDAINSFNPLLKIKYYFEHLPGDQSSIDELLGYFLLPEAKTLFELHSYELSGGMAQRIAIVLALRSNADLLILDEPTSNLDSPVVNLLVNRLKSYILSAGKSVLVVTQDIPFANAISTKVAILDKGSFKEILDAETFISGQTVKPL